MASSDGNKDVSLKVKILSSVFVTLLIVAIGIFLGKLVYKGDYQYVCVYQTNVADKVGNTKIYIKQHGNDIHYKTEITIKADKEEPFSPQDYQKFFDEANKLFAQYRNLAFGYSNSRIVINYSGEHPNVKIKLFKNSLEETGAKCM